MARSVLLTPSDQAKLLLAVAGMVARDRLERGVKLNQPEAVALLSCWVIERAREGRSVADLMAEGRVGARARRRDGGRAGAGGRGAGRGHVPGRPQARDAARADHMIPGEMVTADGELELNAGRETQDAAGDEHRRPADPGRLALRVRVGQRRAGVRSRRRRAASGWTSRRGRRCASSRARSATSTWSRSAGRGRCGGCDEDRRASATARCTGRRSATACGSRTPTSGSRSRRTAASAATRPCSAAARRSASRCCRAMRVDGAPDIVITNVVVLDHWGVVKCDVGDQGRPDRRAGQGRQPGRDGRGDDIEIGPTTEIIAGEGRILTAGGIDGARALHLPADRRRGGRGGHDDADRRRHRPGRGHAGDDLHAVAVGDPRDAARAGPVPGQRAAARQGQHGLRRGPARDGRGRRGRLQAARGLGLDARRDRRLPARAEETGVQVAIHTDTLNEAGFVQSTLAAIGGRSIHAYHTEGAGGGHAPDIITVASQPNVLPGSTNPTRPHTVNTVDEHLDMLIVCHHLNPRIPEDLAFAESRIRGTTIAAEDVLHDLGAISMIGSDSQAMGRVGETIIRTWQTAHVMAAKRGGDGNERLKRYVAKYTICPAIAHGIDGEVGSVEVGKLADLVLWDPAYFAIRPRLVIKGGAIAYAPMGDANASIPTPQPVLMRPMFAGSGRLAARRSLAFVSPLARRGARRPRAGVGRRRGRRHALA